jgi:hypothetical protein
MTVNGSLGLESRGAAIFGRSEAKLDPVARSGDLPRFPEIYGASTYLVNSPEHIGSVLSSPSDAQHIAELLARRELLLPV